MDIPDITAPNQKQSDVRDYIRGLDTTAIFQEMVINPNASQDIITRALSGLTPEMIQQSESLRDTPIGNEFLQEQARRGIAVARRTGRGQPTESNATRANNATAAQRQINQMRRDREAANSYKQVVLMGPNRKLSLERMQVGREEADAKKLLKAKAVAQIPCPQLSPTVRVWYMPDFNLKFKHVRATKILGFPVGGEFLFFDTVGDLNLATFNALESNMNAVTSQKADELAALAMLID